MNTPLVSVIIPVYNVAPYLRQCLDSVCNQTLKNIEIICVDDGSTDGSLDILKEYAARDSRVQVIQQQNQYAGVARQNGMAAATGKYLAFLDSDDFFEPDMFEAMAEAAEKNGTDVVVCGSDCYREDKDDFIAAPWNLRLEYVEGANLDCFSPAKLIPEKIFHFVSPTPWAKLFRASFVRKHHLYWAPLQHTNDILFVCSALAKAETWSVVNKVFVHYRMRSNSISHSKGKDIRVHYAAFEELKARLIELGVDEKIMHSFNERLLTGVVWNLGTLHINGARELRELIIGHYEPKFKLLDEPLECYEQKPAYRRYKALIKPQMTVLIKQGDIIIDELEGFLTRLLGMRDSDFDILCVSYDRDSRDAAIFAQFADKDLRCEHLTVGSRDSMNSTASHCRGRHVIRMSNGKLFQYQMAPIFAKVETIEHILPAGEYTYEYLAQLAKVIPSDFTKQTTSLPLLFHFEHAVEVMKMQQTLNQLEVLKQGNARLQRMLQLSILMPQLLRKYRMLQFRMFFTFGQHKKKLRERKQNIKGLIREYRSYKMQCSGLI